jgi:4-carboxymuconolactone decarboxylase
MPRLAVIPPEQMNAEQRKVYEESVALGTPDGTSGGPYTAYIRNPEYMRLHRGISLYLRNCALPGRLRQMLVLRTIKHWGARYPWVVQVRASIKEGLERSIIDAIEKEQSPALSAPQDIAALRFCDELLETKQVSDATYKHAVETLGEPAVVDIIAVIGLFTTTSLTANAFEIAPPKE